MTNRKGYYDMDFDIEQILIQQGMIEELFHLNDIRRRKLFLNDEINQFSVSDVIKHIMQYNSEDAGKPVGERTPILLYVTSLGGSVDAGFGLIDAIKTSETPVYTINLSFQYSMGFLIGLAGHKRFAMPNAKFLMHDGSNFVQSSGTKVKDVMEFNQRVDDRIKEYIIGCSNLTSEEYDDKLRVEWYLFADEAKEKGFTDYIIGVDCKMHEVV